MGQTHEVIPAAANTRYSVNEIFDPSNVDPFYSQPSSTRALINAEHRTTNYGVVRLDLLEHIYQTLYMQRVHHPNPEDWQHRIANNSTIVGVDGDSPTTIRLQVARKVVGSLGEKESETELQEYDAVIIATGYTRNIHEDILAPARSLMAGGDKPDNKWTVSRDYKVLFEEGMVSEDAGIYLQGCNEQSHGVSLVQLIDAPMLTTAPARGYTPQHSRYSRRRDRPVDFWW